ncbi:uncharacterized protein [Triticum aestivum]|uniref:uncharacterized protein isoform X1 n=1 Tax=Triticum aestivum TaxID=4565 RepID=UPI001D022CEF|nr:uncharacterized protein LOC123149052 isoform X1 [Triticum aestivum]
MRKILLFAMGPGRWQALTCVRRCNSHTSTLPTHAIISGAKMIWCLQRSLLLHFLREKPSQALISNPYSAVVLWEQEEHACFLSTSRVHTARLTGLNSGSKVSFKNHERTFKEWIIWKLEPSDFLEVSFTWIYVNISVRGLVAMLQNHCRRYNNVVDRRRLNQLTLL